MILSWKDRSAILKKGLPLLVPWLIFLLSLSWWEEEGAKKARPGWKLDTSFPLMSRTEDMATPGSREAGKYFKMCKYV